MSREKDQYDIYCVKCYYCGLVFKSHLPKNANVNVDHWVVFSHLRFILSQSPQWPRHSRTCTAPTGRWGQLGTYKCLQSAVYRAKIIGIFGMQWSWRLGSTSEVHPNHISHAKLGRLGKAMYPSSWNSPADVVFVCRVRDNATIKPLPWKKIHLQFSTAPTTIILIISLHACWEPRTKRTWCWQPARGDSELLQLEQLKTSLDLGQWSGSSSQVTKLKTSCDRRCCRFPFFHSEHQAFLFFHLLSTFRCQTAHLFCFQNSHRRKDFPLLPEDFPLLPEEAPPELPPLVFFGKFIFWTNSS